MDSWQAMKRVIGSNAIEFAKALRKSTPLIHKWCEPSTDYTDSGAYNPLDRIELIIEKSLSLNTPIEDAHAPIYYLAERFGLIVIPLPASDDSTESLPEDLIQTMAEVGHVAEATNKALKDNKIKKHEADDIEKETWHLIRQASKFLRKVKNSIVGRKRI